MEPQMHGSTQTFELLNSQKNHELEILEEQNIIQIKDKFPISKKILQKKNEKLSIEPLEILNKFKKKLTGDCLFQKKLNKENKKKVQENKKKEEENKNIFTLDVRKLQGPQINQENNMAKTYSFFPKENGKSSFMTSLKSKDTKKTYFGLDPTTVPSSQTIYSKYILKDFGNPSSNEFDENGNMNFDTFNNFFVKKNKQKNNFGFSNREVKARERETKQVKLYERKIQNDFLHKISFPEKENMGKSLNNFKINKGLIKINDRKGLYSQDGNHNKDKDKDNDKKEKKNFQNFQATQKTNLTQKSIEEITPLNHSTFKRLFLKNDNNKNPFKMGNTSTNKNKTKDNFNNNNLFAISGKNFYNENNLNNFNNFNNFNSLAKRQLEKIHKNFDFDINNPSNLHALKLLRISDNQERLGLTKRVNFQFQKKPKNTKFDRESLRKKIEELRHSNNIVKFKSISGLNSPNGNDRKFEGKNKQMFSEKFDKKENDNNNYNYNFNFNEYVTETDRMNISKNFMSSPSPNNYLFDNNKYQI